MRFRVISSIVLLVVFLMGSQAFAAYQVELPETFTSGSGLFRMRYPEDWTAHTVGPALFWFTSPGTEVWANTPIPPGGARVLVRLPAQNNLVGVGGSYTQTSGEPIMIGGQEWRFVRSGGQFPSTAVAFEYSDGWLDILIYSNFGDQARSEALLLAMAETIAYEPVTNPTATSTPTITPTRPPTATPTATATLSPVDQVFSFADDYFTIRHPAEWFGASSIQDQSLTLANSLTALAALENGDDLPDSGIVITIYPGVPGLSDNPVIVTGIDDIVLARMLIQVYDRLDYPAFVFEISGRGTERSLPHHLTGILADIDGAVTLFVIVTDRPFEENAAQINAILNTAAYKPQP